MTSNSSSVGTPNYLTDRREYHMVMCLLHEMRRRMSKAARRKCRTELHKDADAFEDPTVPGHDVWYPHKRALAEFADDFLSGE